MLSPEEEEILREKEDADFRRKIFEEMDSLERLADKDLLQRVNSGSSAALSPEGSFRRPYPPLHCTAAVLPAASKAGERHADLTMLSSPLRSPGGKARKGASKSPIRGGDIGAYGLGGTPRMRWSDMAEERKLIRSSGRDAPPPEAVVEHQRAYLATASRGASRGGEGRLEGVEQMSAFVSSTSMYSPERRKGGKVAGVAGRPL